MRPNRKELASGPLWFQSLSFYGRPHGGLLQQKKGQTGVWPKFLETWRVFTQSCSIDFRYFGLPTDVVYGPTPLIELT
jgi:hypothetical protein